MSIRGQRAALHDEHVGVAIEHETGHADRRRPRSGGTRRADRGSRPRARVDRALDARRRRTRDRDAPSRASTNRSAMRESRAEERVTEHARPPDRRPTRDRRAPLRLRATSSRYTHGCPLASQRRALPVTWTTLISCCAPTESSTKRGSAAQRLEVRIAARPLLLLLERARRRRSSPRARASRTRARAPSRRAAPTCTPGCSRSPGPGRTSRTSARASCALPAARAVAREQHAHEVVLPDRPRLLEPRERLLRIVHLHVRVHRERHERAAALVAHHVDRAARRTALHQRVLEACRRSTAFSSSISACVGRLRR